EPGREGGHVPGVDETGRRGKSIPAVRLDRQRAQVKPAAEECEGVRAAAAADRPCEGRLAVFIRGVVGNASARADAKVGVVQSERLVGYTDEGLTFEVAYAHSNRDPDRRERVTCPIRRDRDPVVRRIRERDDAVRGIRRGDAAGQCARRVTRKSSGANQTIHDKCSQDCERVSSKHDEPPLERRTRSTTGLRGRTVAGYKVVTNTPRRAESRGSRD